MNRAGLLLVGREILQPLAEEGGNVHVESRRSREDLCITSPSQAFVPLGTVGRDVEEVSFLPPKNVGLQLIDRGLEHSN